MKNMILFSLVLMSFLPCSFATSNTLPDLPQKNIISIAYEDAQLNIDIDFTELNEEEEMFFYQLVEQMVEGMPDKAVKCEVSITGRIGNNIVGFVETSITVTGPCDEIVKTAQEKWNDLKKAFLE